MVEEDYISYLLRLWKVVRDGRPDWQASLESTLTGERVNLTLEDLVAFLEDRFGSSENQEERRRR